MATSHSISTDKKALPLPLVEKCRAFCQICFRLVELFIHCLWQAMRLSGHLLLNWLGRQQRSRQAILGVFLTDLCDALGATFTKIGQILSTRCDLLPPELIQPLARLQDRARPFSFRSIPALIQEELGRPWNEIFAEFDEQPISSASVASVYRARLHNGAWVAVKIRRPGITRKVRNDLAIMRWVARRLARLKAMQLIPVVDMIDELGRLIEQQLDFQLEARNNRLFHAHFAGNQQVHIPQLMEDYCSAAILTMEFFPGLVRIDELDWEESEYQEALLTGLRALYSMIFLHGFIHCDMHPGNFYFLKGGEVVLLDMGFVARLQRDDRYQFGRFFFDIATNSGRDCARILYDTASFHSDAFQRDIFEREVIELINRSSGAMAADFQVATFAAQLFDIQRRNGLRGSNNFTMAILSLLVFEGIAKQTYPRLDFQREARPFLLQALKSRARANEETPLEQSRS